MKTGTSNISAMYEAFTAIDRTKISRMMMYVRFAVLSVLALVGSFTSIRRSIVRATTSQDEKVAKMFTGTVKV